MLGKTAMTPAQRQQRRRARLRKERPLARLRAAWDACDKAQRSRFLRGLRAASLQRKKERRAALERALADKISGARPMEPAGTITGWLNGLPIISGGPSGSSSGQENADAPRPGWFKLGNPR
jgi:hypothetical protein